MERLLLYYFLALMDDNGYGSPDGLRRGVSRGLVCMEIENMMSFGLIGDLPAMWERCSVSVG